MRLLQFLVVFQLVHSSQQPSKCGFYTHHFSLSIIPVATDTTVQIFDNILYLQLYVTFGKEDANGMRINDEQVMRYNSLLTFPYTLQTVAQPDCCATKFKPLSKSSNCCTNCQTTPHTIKQFAQQLVLGKLFDRVCGPLHPFAMRTTGVYFWGEASEVTEE
jgi:hypothetical protein